MENEMELYREIRVVGRGSFGAVHLCERLSDGKQVIIKRVSIDQMTDSDLAASCTEVRVLSMLRHPLVVRYLDSAVQEETLHIIMEYLPGGTLRDFLRARAGRLLPQQDVVTWASQLVLALYHIHSHNVLHRDITSSNILLTANHRCLKVGDFGISKILASKSRAQTLVGTPCYLSPELCDGRAYGRESDVWATGVVIFEMLALHRPFEAPTKQEDNVFEPLEIMQALQQVVLQVMQQLLNSFHGLQLNHSVNTILFQVWDIGVSSLNKTSVFAKRYATSAGQFMTNHLSQFMN